MSSKISMYQTWGTRQVETSLTIRACEIYLWQIATHWGWCVGISLSLKTLSTYMLFKFRTERSLSRSIRATWKNENHRSPCLQPLTISGELEGRHSGSCTNNSCTVHIPIQRHGVDIGRVTDPEEGRQVWECDSVWSRWVQTSVTLPLQAAISLPAF